MHIKFIPPYPHPWDFPQKSELVGKRQGRSLCLFPYEKKRRGQKRNSCTKTIPQKGPEADPGRAFAQSQTKLSCRRVSKEKIDRHECQKAYRQGSCDKDGCKKFLPQHNF